MIYKYYTILITIFFYANILYAQIPVLPVTDSPITLNSGHSLDSADIAGPFKWHWKTGLKWIYPGGVGVGRVGLKIDTALGMGLPGKLEINLGLPFGITVKNDSLDTDSGAGLGDIRASLLFSPFVLKKGGLGFLAGVTLFAPSGKNSIALGEGGFSYKGFTVVEWNILGAVLGVNAGYLFRPYQSIYLKSGELYKQDDEFFWGVRLRIVRSWDVAWSLETKGAVGIASTILNGGENVVFEGNPIWIGGGLDFPGLNKTQIKLNLFFLVNYIADGAMISFSINRQGTGLDEDMDGVKGRADKCPVLREDIDGFRDWDGCPDVDNDKDGFPDSEDKCPNIFGDEFSDDGC